MQSHLENQVLITDFNMVATYYTLGGEPIEYFHPKPTRTGRYTEESGQLLVRYYYKNPGSAAYEADIYTASVRMERYGFEFTQIETVPNDTLRDQLSESTLWNQVYTNGDERSFAAIA
jgi:hypothetical protein